jgi:hypothetical protein
MSLTNAVRILMLLWLAPWLNAQGGGAPWNDLRSKNPPGLLVTLRLVNPHAFRQGELIDAELKLPDNRPVQNEQWQFAGILLEPPADCGTVEVARLYARRDEQGHGRAGRKPGEQAAEGEVGCFRDAAATHQPGPG